MAQGCATLAMEKIYHRLSQFELQTPKILFSIFKQTKINFGFIINIQRQEKMSQADKKQQEKKKPMDRKPSFQRKSTLVNTNKFGEEVRPKLARVQTIDNMTDQLYNLMDSYLSNKVPDVQKQIVNHVEYTLARTRFDFKSIHCYQATAHTVRDRLLEYFNDTHRVLNYSGKKKVYYMSLEYLIGRCFQNALINLNVEEPFKEAIKDFGYSFEKLRDKEVDAGLGNGGLGRLAACFLDSLATLNYPAWGYGIRYDYGIFKQFIKNGYQWEAPDFWLSEGNPWEIERIDVQYKIRFYGNTRVENKDGKQRVIWENGETILARAFDTPIPGYATFNTIGLRLWKSLPFNEFDFGSFNSGQYWKALQAKQRAQYITSVLYPNDSTWQGKELRLKQQYLLVSATIQDIIRRHKAIAQIREQKFEWQNFASSASIQLNDTHPALSIVELMRILIDEEGLDREAAWDIVYNTFSYTNHTVMPEALEKWSVDLLGNLLPRHLELIYLINFHFLESVAKKLPEEEKWKIPNLSIVEESNPKQLRMANLSIIGSHKVNGVAALHTELLKKYLFKDFYDLNPDKFVNVTNGVTTRRWIIMSNPLLSDLYTDTLMTDEWLTNMDLLRPLEKYATDAGFQSKWQAIKQVNKRNLVTLVKSQCNVDIDENSMFDVQIKRIHEYKRQLMNILYVIHRYLELKAMSTEQRIKVVPRTVIFAGKAAPGYQNAKKVIKFINQVSVVLNNDQITKSLLKVVFIPNYNVSKAEIIIPATELSQHISTAGTEASGTSNMKFVLNGSLIIGTMDGANVEIHEEVGDENIFIFGAREEEVHGKRDYISQASPGQYIPASLHRVIQVIREGLFAEKDIILSLLNTITSNNDWYLVTQDFESYIECQKKIDQAYKNKKNWTKMSILNAIRSGKFSSDRTIREYSEKIWNVEPCKVIDDIKPGTRKGDAVMREVVKDTEKHIPHKTDLPINLEEPGVEKVMPANRPDSKTDIKSQKTVEPAKVDAKTQPKVQPKAEPKIEPKVDPKAGPKADTTAAKKK